MAEDVADIVTKYPKYNLWRKAEAQMPNIFSVVNHKESDNVERLWKELEEKAEAVKARVPEEARDAYFQLVYYPPWPLLASPESIWLRERTIYTPNREDSWPMITLGWRKHCMKETSGLRVITMIRYPTASGKT